MSRVLAERVAEWPKMVWVRGIAIQTGSWDELDELIRRYGTHDTPRPQAAMCVKDDREDA